MDPVSAVFTAIQIAKAIHAQLEQLKQNRQDCIDLAGRISALLGAIEACKENQFWINTNGDLLNRLVKDLNEAQEFINTLESAFDNSKDKNFNKKQRLGQAKAFFGATNDAATIQHLNARISQHVTDLQLGSSAALLRQNTAGFGEVNSKLDKMDALLGALQSMLIAGQVGAAMGNNNTNNMKMNNNNNGSFQQQQQNSNIPGNTNYETNINMESSSSSSVINNPITTNTNNPSPKSDTLSQNSPKIGRALEVAAHQFVFGSFMAGLACVYPNTWYRTSILLCSPLIPAGFMALVYIAVGLQAYKKMQQNWKKTIQQQEEQGLPIDRSNAPKISIIFGSIAAQLLIPLQLYSTPTLGGLAALAGAAYFEVNEGTNVTSDYHTALVGVAVGTIIFAISYLANAR